MSQFNIEELRSQENYADTNFMELQELRKIHQLTLQRVDILEKLLSDRAQLILTLMNDKRKLIDQFHAIIDNCHAAVADATHCEQASDALEGKAD